MAYTFIPSTAPSYIALSTDVVDSKISGVTYVGATVYLTDTKKSYVIMPDLSLVESTIVPQNTTSTAINVQPKDQYGWIVENTPFDEMRVVTPIRLVGATFSGSVLDSNFWTSGTGTASGSVIQLNNQVILTTGSGVSGSASSSLQSVRTARWVGGSANRFRGQLRMGDSGTIGNERRWGSFNGVDGAYFKLSGSSLYACTIKGGAETAVISSSWNGSTTTPTLTNITSYEIYPTSAKVYYVISGIIVHTANFPTSPWTNTSNYSIRMDNTNSGSVASQVIMESRVATIYRLGEELTAPTYKHIVGAVTSVLKYAPGTLHKITINTPGTLCTVYDGTSITGAVVGIIDTNKTSGNSGTLTYDSPFFNGLTVVTTGAGTDLTVIYE